MRTSYVLHTELSLGMSWGSVMFSKADVIIV